MGNVAAVMTEVGKIELRDVAYPDVGPTQAVVAVEAVGVCGSDAAYYHYGRIGDYVVDGPIILGHEAAGTIVRAGSAVTRVKVGDRVAIEPGTPCMRCRECRQGRYHLCPDMVFLATPPYDGALVRHLAMDEGNLFPIPDSLDFDSAAMLEPLSVGIWACRRAQLEPGDEVLVTGAGPVGILSAQVARALGAASVTVTDVSAYRRSFAERLGFAVEIAEAPSEREFDVLLECSGAAAALVPALRRLRTNGRAALVGLAKTPIEIPFAQLNPRELTISLVNRYVNTWPTAITLASSGRVDLGAVVTHRFGLAETEEAVTLAMRVPASMKAIIHPQR